MIKTKKRPPLTDIDVGSFSDVSFLLIIFFILTTQIAAFKGTVVEVPAGSPDKSESKEKKEQMTVFLTYSAPVTADSDGVTYRIGTGSKSAPMEVTLDELKAKLLSENYPARDKKERMVILEHDGNVPYSAYYKVLVLISNAGAQPCFMKDESKGGGEGGGES